MATGSQPRAAQQRVQPLHREVRAVTRDVEVIPARAAHPCLHAGEVRHADDQQAAGAHPPGDPHERGGGIVEVLEHVPQRRRVQRRRRHDRVVDGGPLQLHPDRVAPRRHRAATARDRARTSPPRAPARRSARAPRRRRAGARADARPRSRAGSGGDGRSGAAAVPPSASRAARRRRRRPARVPSTRPRRASRRSRTRRSARARSRRAAPGRSRARCSTDAQPAAARRARSSDRVTRPCRGSRSPEARRA